MSVFEEEKTYCPYCGELIDLLIDVSMVGETYVEDCFVCCRPIVVSVQANEGGGLSVDTKTEND